MASAVPAPILVVDDDPKIVSLVRLYLEREGFRVVSAADGRTALRSTETEHPRLVVLDVMLPELDGISVMHRIREMAPVPIVMLSARGSAPDRVFGISEGADDYLSKPFSPSELVVRVKAVLRRTDADRGARGVRGVGDLEVDFDRREVTREGRRIPLTPAEFSLLAALVGARGRLLTRRQLLDAIDTDVAADPFERTVDVHIGRLRAKLDDPPAISRYVVTVRGAGYRANIGSI
jgi:two-component system, OmpR family, alkaline phosphatase synthesis response regulator PhoP